MPRSATAREYIDRYYEPLANIKNDGLDALIVSGANVTRPILSEEIFWDELSEVIGWADENVTSTLCSCLATHAVVLARHGIERQPLENKCWGLFDHDVVRADHPLVVDTNNRLTVPHSRFNEVTREQFESAGLHVLIEGEVPGVQLVVSADGFRTVFFQGHPEYDTISLLKEYKRDVGLYINHKTDRYPPFPCNYLDRYSQVFTQRISGTSGFGT